MKLRKQSHIWLFNSCTYMCTHPHTHTHTYKHIHAYVRNAHKDSAEEQWEPECGKLKKTLKRQSDFCVVIKTRELRLRLRQSVSQSVSPSLRMSVCQLPSVIIISQVPCWSLAKQMQSKLNIGLCPAHLLPLGRSSPAPPHCLCQHYSPFAFSPMTTPWACCSCQKSSVHRAC